ncbi:hypothetical protein JIN85_17045 [Luteolibacter pohnpeiensis]|uniref:Chromosomal replication initiator DnaA C-terminal domain-containing protein n=1 Tax=Luteolibacter pohnpeiensis TaxID=454153 RepID=A0A934SA16_9BACT|nr:helix-turn-helix domain-containing protein [Luteolibacter pohnpeiensis]MBK1884130.1 hypothetical protein [Luteolibacter pohnpeiensis]
MKYHVSARLDRLIDAASEFTGFSREDLLSTRRPDRLARTRWAIWSILRADDWTLREIGNAFNRDHGAVIHGLRRAAFIAGREPQFAALMRHLKMTIRQPLREAQTATL